MQSFDTGNATFHHNGDLSGDVIIVETTLASDTRPAPTVHISFEDIRDFYLEMRRRRAITELENMSYEELDKL